MSGSAVQLSYILFTDFSCLWYMLKIKHVSPMVGRWYSCFLLGLSIVFSVFTDIYPLKIRVTPLHK